MKHLNSTIKSSTHVQHVWIINASENVWFCKTENRAPRETLPDYKDDLPGSYRVPRIDLPVWSFSQGGCTHCILCQKLKVVVGFEHSRGWWRGWRRYKCLQLQQWKARFTVSETCSIIVLQLASTEASFVWIQHFDYSGDSVPHTDGS